jgi:hypothetical protein
MKYYIGYFNKPWKMDEFTVICATVRKNAAQFILSKYQESASDKDLYVMLSAADIMNKELIF